ncbi:hypothetical protein Q1695_010748 [Nippostrongylus brasiliensis]|nr:hypothetical protein Q1695_010748 [Nippostrongylus brasiliensis]
MPQHQTIVQIRSAESPSICNLIRFWKAFSTENRRHIITTLQAAITFRRKLPTRMPAMNRHYKTDSLAIGKSSTSVDKELTT